MGDIIYGKWLATDYDAHQCSICGGREDYWWADKGTPFCPWCGNPMHNQAKNRWLLTDDIREKIAPLVKQFLDKLDTLSEDEMWDMADEYDCVSIDLSDMRINPYQLRTLLEEDFGYTKHDLDTNGWELDFWLRMTNPEKTSKRKLLIQGCGMTAELRLCYELEG